MDFEASGRYGGGVLKIKRDNVTVMHMLFIDESGRLTSNPTKDAGHFVLGGIIIPEATWSKIADDLALIKSRYAVSGEVKWRYFVANNNKPENALRHLSMEDRNTMRMDIFEMIGKHESIRVLFSATDLFQSHQGIFEENSFLADSLDLWDPFDRVAYHMSYGAITEAFQAYLKTIGEMTGEVAHGLVICDQRNSGDDQRLRDYHQLMHAKLICNQKTVVHRFSPNLVESLFLVPSHYSEGIQLADIVAGAIHRKINSNDERFYIKIEHLILPETDEIGVIYIHGK